MKTIPSRITLMAGFVLALAFILSACSSDGDDKDDKWSSYINSDGTGGNDNFNVSSQVEYRDGKEYKSSRKIQFPMCDLSKYGALACIASSNLMYYADAGNVTDGIVNLDLPNKISDKYLSVFEEEGCNIFPENIKYYSPLLYNRFDLNIRYYAPLLEYIEIDDEMFMMDTSEGIDYIYFSKAGKITCNYEYEFESLKSKTIKNIDAKAGWNKIYFHEHCIETSSGERYCTETYSTDNILTNETKLKWIFRM
jgi:hypothetical protein